MHALIIFGLLAMSSLTYAGPREKFIDVQHDSHRGATCWILNESAISCLPDSQLRNTESHAGLSRDTDTLAGDEPQSGPTPARSPAPRQHREVFQL